MNNMPPRPLRNSPKLRSAIAASLMLDVIRWCNERSDGFLSEDDIGLIAAQIKTVVGAYNLDGYLLAKILERDFNWKPDGTLVGILDEACELRDKAYDDEVRAWVADNLIKPALKIGDHVNITLTDPRGAYRGIVVAFTSDTAQYAVSVPNLGQTFDPAIGGQYFLVDYEVLEAEQHLDQDAVKNEDSGVAF